MAKKKNLSSEQRAAVVTLSTEQYSGCAMAKKLKISLCAVQEIFKKAQETGTIRDRERSGRPSLTTIQSSSSPNISLTAPIKSPLPVNCSKHGLHSLLVLLLLAFF